ncbi:PEP-CTERM sorting domain-containing protein [Rariglobus hedericola]|uniref:PEP-CTERM sorting domain-containing protein n=1 Tax=Rariglobus hedericola TaxID=2597822 RepID=A0A556QKZ4_9BACT|nr:PEP-CTERM sorting domain-containing protein [Rariglobus hedericola]TSJ77314.1 PEP-CTERM sorting domain-containing protein [Rariglobus hedericola]
MNPVQSALPKGYSIGACLLAGLLAVSAVSSAHAATILVDDQFNDGGLTNGADPLDTAWTTTAGTLSVTSNALTQSATTFFAVKADTGATALTNGGANDSITLSLDLRATSNPGAADAGFRFGFSTATKTYLFHIGTGGTAPGGFKEFSSPDSISGGGATYTTSPTPGVAQSITNTAYHTFSMTITRSGASSLSFIATLDGTTYTSVTSNSISDFTFNRIILGEGGTAIPFAVDNVLVTQGTIPEPSTYAALVGLAALGLVAFKRSRSSH